MARDRGSPEFTKNGALGVKSSRAWVRDEVHDTSNLPRALAEGCRGCSAGRSSGGGTAAAELAGVRIRATPGLCTGVKWVREFARDSSKLRQGLRGVLWRSSELATVRPRLRVAASHRRWCSGQGVILYDSGSSLAAGVGHGEAHLGVGLGNAGSTWVDFTAE